MTVSSLASLTEALADTVGQEASSMIDGRPLGHRSTASEVIVTRRDIPPLGANDLD
jgi:hypothetical protein